MENLTINDLKQCKIYVIESKTSVFITCFDRLEDSNEKGKYFIKDFFCVASSKQGLYTMQFMCNAKPLTNKPLSIREATEEETYIFFTRVRAEMLNHQINMFENDDAGQREGND